MLPVALVDVVNDAVLPLADVLLSLSLAESPELAVVPSSDAVVLVVGALSLAEPPELAPSSSSDTVGSQAAAARAAAT